MELMTFSWIVPHILLTSFIKWAKAVFLHSHTHHSIFKGAFIHFESQRSVATTMPQIISIQAAKTTHAHTHISWRKILLHKAWVFDSQAASCELRGYRTHAHSPIHRKTYNQTDKLKNATTATNFKLMSSFTVKWQRHWANKCTYVNIPMWLYSVGSGVQAWILALLAASPPLQCSVRSVWRVGSVA